MLQRLQIEPLEVVIREIEVEDGAESRRSEPAAQFVAIIPLGPWRPVTVRHLAPLVEAGAARLDPTLLRIDQFDPSPARPQMLQHVRTFDPCDLERHMVQGATGQDAIERSEIVEGEVVADQVERGLYALKTGNAAQHLEVVRRNVGER